MSLPPAAFPIALSKVSVAVGSIAMIASFAVHSGQRSTGHTGPFAQEVPTVSVIELTNPPTTEPPTTNSPATNRPTVPQTTPPTRPQPTTTTTVMVRRQIHTRTYVRPTNRPVADPWRAPANQYGAGNRGIEFATLPGDTIWIAESGTVTFAGWVAGTYYLVVAHPDGIRTTLGNLKGSRYRAGDAVKRGSGAGFAAGPLHFGARVGDRYVDPTPLLGPLPHAPWLTK